MDYSFHHIQNFTDDVSVFKGKIDASTVGGGADLPESGMDAIMQTIVCQGFSLKTTWMSYLDIKLSNIPSYIQIVKNSVIMLFLRSYMGIGKRKWIKTG